MQRLSTTVVAVIGEAAEDVAAVLRDDGNVRVIPSAGDVVATWAEVVRTRSPFCVITDDPLGAVAAAWDELFRTRSASGTLEVVVSEALSRIRSGTVDLPDFYLVRGEGMFHLAVLQPLAPARVVPVDSDIRRTVSTLGAGRWWPRPEILLDRLERRLPDRFEAPEAREGEIGDLLLG